MPFRFTVKRLLILVLLLLIVTTVGLVGYLALQQKTQVSEDFCETYASVTSQSDLKQLKCGLYSVSEDKSRLYYLGRMLNLKIEAGKVLLTLGMGNNVVRTFYVGQKGESKLVITEPRGSFLFPLSEESSFTNYEISDLFIEDFNSKYVGKYAMVLARVSDENLINSIGDGLKNFKNIAEGEEMLSYMNSCKSSLFQKQKELINIALNSTENTIQLSQEDVRGCYELTSNLTLLNR